MRAPLRVSGGFLAAASLVAGSWFPDVITRDVAIIGGGASGAYAAVRLKEDYGQRIVVIEKADRLVLRDSSPVPFFHADADTTGRTRLDL